MKAPRGSAGEPITRSTERKPTAPRRQWCWSAYASGPVPIEATALSNRIVQDWEDA